MICFFFARIKNGEIPLFGHVLLGSPPPLHQSNKSNNTSSQKKRERKMMDRIFRRRLLLRTYTNSSISNTQTHMLRSRRKIQFGKQTCVSTTDHACMAKWEMVVNPNLLILISWWPGVCVCVCGLQIEFPSVQSKIKTRT